MRFTVKKILSTALAVLLVIIACVSFNVEYANAQTMPEYIKVGLKYGSSSASEYEVNFDKGIRLGVGYNDEFNEMREFEDINKVLICIQAGSVQLIGTKNSGETVIINEGQENANCIMPYDYENGETVAFENSKYRGGIMFNVSSGSLTIINFVPIEEYLYGVINGELNKSNPIEALKAQAVAARSFAVCKLGTHNSNGFDLCATTHCQMYRGYNDEYNETTKAVDETKGETINYDEKTVAAFFFKNSGGYTQAIEDVWGSKAGYLKAVKDEYSPTYSWNQSFTFSELSSKLATAGYNVGQITNVAITKRNQSGAVDTMQFTGTSGTATLEKNKIRTVLGATLIKSNNFYLGEAPSIPNDVNKAFKGYAISKIHSNATEIAETVYVINKSGVISQSDTNNIYIHNGKDTKCISNMVQSSNDTNNQGSNKVESVSGGNVTFTGLGYGHGIGMPQDGAVEMAKKGFTYEDILKYYYTDITID